MGVLKFLKRLVVGAISVGFITVSTTTYAAKPGLESFPEPVDPQSWVLPRDMTWDDYRPVPGVDWKTADVKPERVIKGALIIVDFPDREFMLSQPEGSEIAGNPVGTGNIPRDQLGKFWVDFLSQNLRKMSPIFWIFISRGAIFWM
ncbi:hypothetical protein [Heyndrickxia sporothermodurans]|uniref:hypothetical protein n=1 Tax=Heyndrickxia sporothermodurans TaxID=46224 RepID=UPI00192C4CB0|nr:hypothetical protein [Heyndrickxia sporothermodurans]MBL5867533.1 hypothetical protein [Heyndrickxia sporothermodurans]